MTTQTNQPAQTNGTAPVKQQVDEASVEAVLMRISDMQSKGELKLPASYSPENALRSAWLNILEVQDASKRPALDVCTKVSIVNALLDMVLQGMSPVKKQCYFIVYGNKLLMQKSYMGVVAVAKRVADVTDAIANIVYEGDEFEYLIDPKTGRKTIQKHVQAIDNIDMDKIKGAYAIVEFGDGKFETEIMTMRQIRAAWSMGATKGASPAHTKFPDEMAKKSVINRALKLKIGSSDDSGLFEDEEPAEDRVLAGVNNQIAQHANKTVIKMPSHTSSLINRAAAAENKEPLPPDAQNNAQEPEDSENENEPNF